MTDTLIPTDHIFTIGTDWAYMALVNDDGQHRLRVFLTYEIDNTKKTVDVEYVISKAAQETPQPGPSGAY